MSSVNFYSKEQTDALFNDTIKVHTYTTLGALVQDYIANIDKKPILVSNIGGEFGNENIIKVTADTTNNTLTLGAVDTFIEVVKNTELSLERLDISQVYLKSVLTTSSPASVSATMKGANIDSDGLSVSTIDVTVEASEFKLYY